MSEELKKKVEWSYLDEQCNDVDDTIKDDIMSMTFHKKSFLHSNEDRVLQPFIDSCLSIFDIKENDLIETCIEKIIEDEGIEVTIKKMIGDRGIKVRIEEVINITVEIKKN